MGYTQSTSMPTRRFGGPNIGLEWDTSAWREARCERLGGVLTLRAGALVGHGRAADDRAEALLERAAAAYGEAQRIREADLEARKLAEEARS